MTTPVKSLVVKAYKINWFPNRNPGRNYEGKNYYTIQKVKLLYLSAAFYLTKATHWIVEVDLPKEHEEKIIDIGEPDYRNRPYDKAKLYMELEGYDDKRIGDNDILYHSFDEGDKNIEALDILLTLIEQKINNHTH